MSSHVVTPWELVVPHQISYFGKRAFDVIVGLVLLLVATPIILVLAAISAVRYSAWPFFVQDRIGLGGRTFRCVKIRSLSTDTAKYADREQLESEATIDRWSSILRRLHLDELPQILMVVMGTMSLVGPRPMIASIVDRMPPAIADFRHSVRPGLTGPWQVSQDGASLVLDAMDYDVAYVERAGFRLDIMLLSATLLQSLGSARRTKKQVFGWLGEHAETSR